MTVYLGAKLELTLVKPLTRHQSGYAAKPEPIQVKALTGIHSKCRFTNIRLGWKWLIMYLGAKLELPQVKPLT